MKISFPKSIVSFGPFSVYNAEGDPDSKVTMYNGWPVDSIFASVETPSYFLESPRGSGNIVCHVKCIEAHYSLGDGKPFAWGTYRATSNDFSHTSTPTIRSYTFYSKGPLDCRCNVAISEWGIAHKKVNFIMQCYYSEQNGNYYVFHNDFFCNVTIDIDRSIKRVSNMSYSYCSKTDAELFADTCLLVVSSDEGFAEFSYSRCKFYTKQIQEAWSHVYTKHGGYTNWFHKSSVQTVTAKLPSAATLTTALLYSENDLFFGSGMGGPFDVYHLKALEQAAYLDALDHVPQLNENSVSNVIELVSFIKALVIDHKVEIPKSLSSAWLAYRYSYGTTKLDAKEAINFVHRQMGSDDLGKGFSCYGETHTIYMGVPVVVKCRLSMKQKELDTLSKIWSALYRYGLSPSFYVVWDLIPYSFIVDWFLPVGDILSGYDKTRMYDREYAISNIWFSVQYDNVDDEGYLCHSYTRWFREELPEFNGYYTLDNKGTTSNRVIGFRILDSLALIFR